MKHAIESDFPFEVIDEIAEIESYRKEIYRPIYHIHKWWAKRLGSVFRSIVSGSLSENEWPDFYKNQKYAGKVVLDPFMGSGTTLGEAAKLGASVIGCDVNPVSTFLVRQALAQVNVDALEAEFQAIECDVKDEIQSYYTTKLPNSGTLVPALYYFWVKTVSTPTGEEIPLFSSYVFSKNAYPKKKPESQILCPSCGSIFVGMYDSTSEVCPSCTHKFDPQEAPTKGANVYDKSGRKHKIKALVNQTTRPPSHKLYAIMALNEDGKKVYIKPSSFDYEQLDRACKKLGQLEKSLPLPKMDVRSGHNTNQAKGYNYNKWRDFFSDRQLLCLGILLKRILKIENETIRDHFVCLFSGSLEFNNLFCSFKGEGTGAVRHMFSNHILKPERAPLENSVWGIPGKSSGTFSTLFQSRLIKAKMYLIEPFELSIHNKAKKRSTEKVVCSDAISLQVSTDWDTFFQSEQGALVLNGDSSELPIPDGSVDVVVTDPPYFDFIHYSELSDFFYAWLSSALGDKYDYLSRKDSSHVNEVQDKDNESFSLKIRSIFAECNRVLKHEGLMCFSYHHSTIDGWMAIYDAITQAGFDIVAAHPVKAEMSVASPKSSTKNPINLDAILVCKKKVNPPMVGNIRNELTQRFDHYVLRYRTLGRKLSAGDKFVIACSQAISLASTARMNSSEARGFTVWAASMCANEIDDQGSLPTSALG